MMKRLVVALALFVLATTASAMDLPPGKWWRRPEVIQMLSLTEEQRSALPAHPAALIELSDEDLRSDHRLSLL